METALRLTLLVLAVSALPAQGVATVLLLPSNGLGAQTADLQTTRELPDTTLQFDPETGLPVEEPREKQRPRFDPETGELIERAPVPLFDPETGELIQPQAALSTPRAEMRFGSGAVVEIVKTSAQINAADDYDPARRGLHAFCGGAGCLIWPIGLPLGALYVELGLLSQFDETSPYYLSLSPEQRSEYKKAYKKREKTLRRNSVYGTQGICLVAYLGLILFVGAI